MEKAIFHTSLGWSGVAASEHGICRIVLPKKDRNAVGKELNCDERGARVPEKFAQMPPILIKAVKLLRRYFSGERVSFDLPLDLRYYTPFQQEVWRATAEIPYGETRSYAWIAKRIENPRAARAVGQALGANPVPVLVP
jgi:O6-methylguanine-DNA--protein-cysteine methyltransferase